MSRRATLQENEFYDIIPTARYEEKYELSLSSFSQLLEAPAAVYFWHLILYASPGISVIIYV